MILKVPYIDQSEIAPTGCESVTACMLLQYLGYDIPVHTFIKNCLYSLPFTVRNGELWGTDPDLAFAGDPEDKEGFGCYAPVLIKAMEPIIQDSYCLKNATGTAVTDLCHRYIEQGMPVPIWSTIDMKPSGLGTKYRLYTDGSWYQWRNHEHCLLLVGYDDKNYWFNDPWHNHGLAAYEKHLFEQRHHEMGMQAIGIIRK